jgi:DNA (cytosine-5)-methyltransferase 1
VEAVSLFSGCGGSDAGLIKLGVDVVVANDILPYAKDVYEANHPDTDYILGNVADIKSFPKVDLLVGCYPCQGFSQGGNRDADSKLNYLYQEFDRALRYIKPKAFVVENVSGMLRSNNSQLFRNQLTRFRLAGYKVKYKLLDARAFGLAQARKRVFLVGVRSDLGIEYEFPEGQYGEGEKKKPYQTLRDAIGHMEEWPEGEFYDYDFHWYYLSRNRYRGWHEQSTTIVSNERHIGLHPVSPKLIKRGPDNWEFESDKPARRYSYKEAAILQGFDEDMVFPENITRTQIYRVIGNAVPPPMFEAVCSKLVDML